MGERLDGPPKPRFDAESGGSVERAIFFRALEAGGAPPGAVMQGGSSNVAGVQEGDVLAGKYRVERVLGVGGMGVVVAAQHIQLDEKVALKFLLPEALGNAEAVERFAREARAAVKIKSEHVARVIDVGTLPNGAPYMVMEYLQGGDLAGWLRQNGPMPLDQAVDFVLQACVAVADAHALGIIHRDLKPANLFCVRRSDGQLSIKVLDFGISKMTDASGLRSGSVTRTSALMGSPLYMSPEQLRSSRDVKAQTDIWALGVILFELMTGRAPFVAESVPELAIRIATDPTPSIRTFRPEVPAALEAVIFQCLEKEARKRPPNVAELALALLPFAPRRARATVERISGIIAAAGLSVSALAVPASPRAVERIETQISDGTLPAVGRTTAVPPPTRRLAVIAVGVAAVITLGGAWALRGVTSSRGGPGTAPASNAVSPPPLSPPPSSPAGPSLLLPAPRLPAPVGDPALMPSARSSLPEAPPVAARPPVNGAPAARPPSSHPAAPSPAGAASARASTPASAPPPEPPPLAAAPGPPPTLSPSKPSCTPPYVIDSLGHRQYKPECL
jgi:serine/threonine-protein kinase